MPNPLSLILKNRAKTQIQSCINEGRLVFLSEDRLRYTDKIGTKFEYTFSEMANAFMNRLGYGGEANTYFGINEETIKTLLSEAYQKQLRRAR